MTRINDRVWYGIIEQLMSGLSRALRVVCVGVSIVALAETARADVWRLCIDAIDAAERQADIPPGLLHAIGRLESGKWQKQSGRSEPWPWTINAEGTGQYFDTKSQAIAKVEALLGQGVGLVDVGCMQVNLHYHGDAFATLEDAFDPDRNAEYAARLLNTLYEETGSWELAAGRYHSATPKFGVPYRERVMASWRQERGVRPSRGDQPAVNSADSESQDGNVSSDEKGVAVALVPIDGDRMQRILLVGQRRLLAARMKREHAMINGNVDAHSKQLRLNLKNRSASINRSAQSTQLPQRNAQMKQVFAERRAEVLERWRASRVKTGKGPIAIIGSEF